jgi:general secretion pathway protein J
MITKHSNGFTLIEVLIAMTLLSIMVVLLFSSLKICADSWTKGENKIAEVNEIAVVYNFFQQHLAVAKPLLNIPKQTSNLQATLAFQGKNQSLQFVSAFPASVGRFGLQLFSIDLQKEDDEQVIKVTIKPFAPLEGDQEQKEEVVLIRRVSDFTISYFGADDATINSGSWRDEWLEKNTQPSLVKISIKRDDNSFWPDMLIPLRITGQHQSQDQNQAIGTAIK